MTTGHTKTIDINCDLGESIEPSDWEKDLRLLPYISSTNIACGGHAGNQQSMEFIISHCQKHNVKIGAHPSYPDKKNFGRAPMQISNEELRISIANQLQEFSLVCKNLNAEIHHVKPHGALYNQAAIDLELAHLISEQIKSINPKIKLMGLAGSQMEIAAEQSDLEFISEAFMDRLYHKNKTLVSRKNPKAVHSEIDDCLEQALNIAQSQPIKTLENTVITVSAESICLHGDTENAVQIAKALKLRLANHNIEIQ